jgi:anti-sigma28 factor (negative regulator of flagellin synthesis)
MRPILNEKLLRLGAAGEFDDVRMDKIASLRLAIAAGTYHVSAEEVAAKMIEDAMRWH